MADVRTGKGLSVTPGAPGTSGSPEEPPRGATPPAPAAAAPSPATPTPTTPTPTTPTPTTPTPTTPTPPGPGASAAVPAAPADPTSPVLSGSPEAARRSRAGRDLPAAVAVGLALVALIVASLLVEKVAFVVLASVALTLASCELTRALAAGRPRLRVPLLPVLVGGVAMLVAAYVGGAGPLVTAAALTALGVVAWRLLLGPHLYLPDVAAGIFVASYAPFLAGFAMLMLRADDGPRRVLLLVVVTVCSDVGGYAAGVIWGSHPMAPTVSPKKSWEGFAGSALACAVGGALGLVLLLDGAWWQGMLVGGAAVCSATLGDLGESMLKRDLGIKDMGSLLPGHGGLMDRLDSLLPTAPVVYLLLQAFVPPA